MMETSKRIIDLVQNKGLILDHLYYSGKRLVWESDKNKWMVYAGKYWDYVTYSGDSLDKALDELIRENK